MITNLNNFVNESLGSSFALPANGLGGSRATSLLVAHFALQNTASNSAEEKNRPREGVAEGGFGGNSATPERIQKTDSPAVLLVKSRTQQKSFLFLLEEKNRRAQIKHCEEIFFAGWRGFRATAGLASLLGVFLKKCSNFVQKTPPSFTFSEIERCCLGASRLGMVFFRYFEGIFEIQNQSAVGNAEVRTNLFEKIPNPFGIFLLSVFFGLVGVFQKGNGKFEPIIALSPKSG